MTYLSQRNGLYLAAVLAVLALLSLLFGGRPDPAPQARTTVEGPGGISLVVSRYEFADLAGWDEDALAVAVPALAVSCDKWLGREDRVRPSSFRQRLVQPSEMAPLCEGLAALGDTPSDEAVRTLLMAETVPIVIAAEEQSAKFTGYFEPAYPARRAAEGAFTTPALTRPETLIDVDLALFDPSLSGRTLSGQLDGTRLVPFATHEEIIATQPAGSDALAYLDPNDLLFLQIQGSGRLLLPDGGEMRVGYAGKNGQPYVAVGRTLVQDGALALENVTMQSIKEWLAEAPAEEAARVRYSNPSYVFFRTLTLPENGPDGPIGAEGVPLSAGRSLAVDDAFYPYGLPIFFEIDDLPGHGRAALLGVGQDTGGAILGVQRADLYVGSGDEAGEIAGRLNSAGRLTILMPRTAADRLIHGTAKDQT